jgi:hypothetical protein
MSHFAETYADRLNELLHVSLGPRFFKQEIVEVPGLVTGLLVTYDGVDDDLREIRSGLTYEEFIERMAIIKEDWKNFDRGKLEGLAAKPEKTIGGWEGRTIYFLRGGSSPDQWTREAALEDAILIVSGAGPALQQLIHAQVANPRDWLPTGRDHFREYEHFVRVVWNYLFRNNLGEGQAQARTEAEQEGVEIRDLVFANRANSGFWKDLKDKYKASEIVVDAKNTDNLTRDDLRQLYCYLKPALGYWGFIVCRAEPQPKIAAFNRTLFKNFRQERGVLILSDDDLRRMVEQTKYGNDPSTFLQDKMSKFVRSV